MLRLIIPKGKSKQVTKLSEIAEEANKLQAAIESGDFAHGPFSLKMIEQKMPKHHIAIHHAQVSEDPYNFFVIKRSVVGGKRNDVIAVINPEILEVDGDPEKHKEGCLSFPMKPDRTVKRYPKARVRYDFVTKLKTLKKKEEWVEGIMAAIFQHETDHGRGVNIY